MVSPACIRSSPNSLAKLKERGFSVKLDTNGFYPDVLEECLGYVDYVALDIKLLQNGTACLAQIPPLDLCIL